MFKPSAKIIADKVYSAVRFVEESKDRYRVLNPFPRSNGDHFSVVLKQDSGKWIFTDEGDTLSEIKFCCGEDVFDSEKKRQFFDALLEVHGVGNKNDELIADEDSLFDLFQALISIETLASF
jgi:hypothetical protein